MKKHIPDILFAILMLTTISIQASVVVITQQGLTFSPSTTTVVVGDTVRWVWTAGVHTTTSADIPSGAATWDSPLTAEVPQFEYIVTTEGTYNYVCTPHASVGMTGSFTATPSLGIGNQVLSSSVRIYPNPASEQASLMLSTGNAGRGTLSVYDLLGNQLNRDEVFVKQGTNTIPVPVADILPGIYFIELKLDNQTAIVRRFVKSR